MARSTCVCVYLVLNVAPVANSFRDTWDYNAGSCPVIDRIYLITWTPGMRDSFDNYRESVAKRLKDRKKPKEVKRFRAESRTCLLGDPGQSASLCNDRNCHLCRAIETGFESTLRHKRCLVYNGQLESCRFGGGIYMSPASSKAFNYAVNAGYGSQYKAVLATRVILGKPQQLAWDENYRLEPDLGYDSNLQVEARPADGGPIELVVYNHNAVRAAYLLILKQ
ncbi:uncharacterized protein EV420DRAFT_1758006 [Desarmillaria tabescens]|uniref:PARP catalytic domain-containing protein n=1 Tax=Armillaria tabescens TaxID=1929756 RepID=A0AA39NLC5_ARMTA|nr:uncharacterized protein EV420DRAFT_1758006 [Desarmillaria tabescens]KAK0467736.1 hypothetical protein EV420DRAFT_1758006 [Desarmillaria tabescens]